MSKRQIKQKGSGNPGTYYNGFGEFYAEYPHVLLGGGNPGFSYEGYGLSPAPYPGADCCLTSPGIRATDFMSPYPKVFTGGARKQGQQTIIDIVEKTRNYLQQKKITWKGLAKQLDEPGLQQYGEKMSGETAINKDMQIQVYKTIGEYYSS